MGKAEWRKRSYSLRISTLSKLVMNIRTTIFFTSMLWLQCGLAMTPILESGIAGLSSRDSLQDSLAKLESRCEEIREVAVEPPTFPLAENKEIHLICRNFSVGAESVGSLALTYADDKLVMLSARLAKLFLEKEIEAK